MGPFVAPLCAQEEERLEELEALTKELKGEIDALKKSQEATKKKEEEKKAKEEEKFTFNIGGQMVMDMLWFSQGPDSMEMVGDADDAFNFRRARLYANGELWHTWQYVMGFDFGQGTAENGRPVFLDNYIGIEDLPVVGNLRIGHFFEPFTLERSGSNRNTLFMERSLVDLFAPSRNIGIMIHDQSEDERFWWGLGTFRGNTDNFGDDAGDQLGQTIDMRLVWRPNFNPADPSHYLHLGAGYSFRDAPEGMLRYRARPDLSGNEDPDHPPTPYFADTGVLSAEHSQLLGGELLWTHGPLSVQSEFVYSPIRLDSGEDIHFSGYYAAVAYFLTGEHIPYNTQFAITDRVRPLAPVFRRRSDGGPLVQGPGAWQIAAKISSVDLSNGSVSGGKLTNGTFGLNWFLTPHHRMKFNYILSDLQRGSRQSYANLFGLRFDMDF